MSNDLNIYPLKEPCYLLKFTTVDRIDIFIRPVYKQIIVHSLNYFIENKGLKVYAWCLMTNELQLLAQAKENCSLAEIENEFRIFTTRKILEALYTEPPVRRRWMMKHFGNIGNLYGLLKKIKVWQAGNPQLFDINKTDTLIKHYDEIHGNPVRERIVDTDFDYLYSSARDYAGMKGLVQVTKLPSIDQQVMQSDTTSSFFGKFIRV